MPDDSTLPADANDLRQTPGRNIRRYPRTKLRRPRVFWVSIFNLFGLACSLVGVLLLFWYALPVKVPGGPAYIADVGEPGWEARERHYDEYAHLGLALVIVGTLCEAVPPGVTAWGSRKRRPRAPDRSAMGMGPPG